MRTFALLFFRAFIQSAFGCFVVTPTILSTFASGPTPEKTVRASFLLDNAYPSAGYAITASMFGLSRFKPNAALTGVLDPTVKQVQSTLAAGKALLARVVAGQLILSYPSGGGGANPTTPVAPKVTTGASTASAVDATTPTITPGLGIDLPNAADASTVTVVLEAIGY